MGTLTMSLNERRRLEVISLVRDKKLPLTRGAALLKLSVRQVRRLWKDYQARGDAGLIHGLRGKPSNHSKKPSFKQQVLERYATCYADFGPTLAAEHLSED